MLARSSTMPPIVAVTACALAGLFSIICAAADFDWFMENRKAQFFVTVFGRNGARVFYVCLGLFLIGLGVFIAISDDASHF
ncbi:hypothetical protein PLCT2_01864 [Planctomycetaceae bacterium]|nr:hypothetical protein PLCT2_01864 [Planctomycetaceae bacterium]